MDFELLPNLTLNQRKNLFIVLFLLLLLTPTLWLLGRPHETRRKAAEPQVSQPRVLSLKPLETNTISLASNVNSDSEVALKEGALKVTFQKGVLDEAVSANQNLKFSLLPSLPGDEKVLRFSLNLEGSLAVPTSSPSPTLVPEVTETVVRPTLVPTATLEPTSTPTLAPTIVPTVEVSPSATPAFQILPKTPRMGEIVLGTSSERPVFASSVPNLERYYTLSYSLSDLRGVYAPSTFRFVWRNPDTGEWEDVPTTIDWNRGIAYARLNHFSEGGAKADKAQVFSPTLKSWETSLYTGSVNHSFPIEVVPGRGGLAPSLLVSYNSNKANALFGDEQKGGVVGAGWDLTLSEIRFDSYEKKQGDPSCNEIAGSRDDGPQYSLILGGREFPLAWVGDGQEAGATFGKFVAKGGNLEIKGYYGKYSIDGPEFFGNASDNCRSRKRIVMRWFVRDTSGTEYHFVVRTKSPETANQYDPSAANRKVHNVYVPTRYMITQIKDLSGNTLDFDYQVPSWAKAGPQPDPSQKEHYFSIYPFTIKYNSGKSAVGFTFEQKQNPPKRPDGDAVFEKNLEFGRLRKIEVFSNVSPATLYKTYDFIYETKASLDTLKRIEVHGPGTAEAKNRFVPTEFEYNEMAVGMEQEALGQELVGCSRHNEFHPIRVTGGGDFGGDWVAELIDKINRGGIPDGQRRKLREAGIAECRSNPPNNCPSNLTQDFYTIEDLPRGNRVNCQACGDGCRCVDADPTGRYCIGCCMFGTEQGSVIYWSKGKAPFLTKVKNGYGGEVNFSYENYFNTNFGFNRNVVKSREVVDVRDTRTPAVKADYLYEKIPNRGGGFGRVTIVDPIAGLRTTTFHFPLAPGNGDGGVDPETNPFYGMPLRGITYSCDLDPSDPGSPKRCGTTGKTKIYSDEYYMYGISPIRTVSYTMSTGPWWDDKTTKNLMNEGFASAVILATETFTPRNANFVGNIPTWSDGKFAFVQNEGTYREFVRRETRSWYDDFGRVVKSAVYADAPIPQRFIDLLNGNKSHEGGSCRQPGSNISGRSLDERDYCSRDNRYVWYDQIDTCPGMDSWDNCRESSSRYQALQGWNSWYFTYGLPMNAHYFDNPSGVDPDKASSCYFSEIWNTIRPLIGEPGSLVRATYTKYLDGYLNKNLQGLVKETFVTDKDMVSFDSVAPSDRWQYTVNSFNDRGLITEVKKVNTYQPSGRLASPDEIIVRTEYDQFGNVVVAVDGRGSRSTISYSSPGKVYDNILPIETTQVVPKEDGTSVTIRSRTSYKDDLWLPEIVTDANSASTKTTYDCLGRVQEIYKPDPNVAGRLSSLSSVTNLYFDYQGVGCGLGAVTGGNALPHLRVKTRLSSSTSDTIYTYSDQISDGLGQTKQTRVLKTKINGNDRSVISEVRFNNRGLKELETLPIDQPAVNLSSDISPAPAYVTGLNFPGQSTSYLYDELGRVLEITDPIGQKTKTEYFGLRTEVTDQNNYVKTSNKSQTISEVNGFGRTVSTKVTNLPDSTSPTYGLVTYPTYDVVGNIIAATQKKCDSATCTGTETLLSEATTNFDHLGRKWKVIDPDLGTWKYAYDANGNLVRQVDNKGQEMTFVYDGLNRLIKKQYPGNARGGLPTVRNFIKYSYDKEADPEGRTTAGGYTSLGKRVNMWDTTGGSYFRYDLRGRLTSDWKGVNKMLFGSSGVENSITRYEYYDSDSLKVTILPTGERVEQRLNEVGQLIGVRSNLGEYLKDQQYNKFGSPTKGILGSSLEATRRYDGLGRLARICVAQNCDTQTGELMDYRYENRDRVGNILGIRDDIPGSNYNLSYTYDNLYQLKTARGLYSASYDYDFEGSMTRKVEGPETVNMQYNDPTHRHAPKVVNGFTYQYDANGNLLEDEARTYIWDFDNKPVKITMKGTGVATEFAYDGDGARVGKKVINP